MTDIRLRGSLRRRWWWAAGAALAAVSTVGMPPVAAANPSTVLSPAAGTPVCQIRDGRLNEISGMAATGGGFVVVNDGADEEARRRIFFLDADCAVARTVRYPSRPRDTEDLGVGADGTVWVADVGDNDRSRRTVALWRLRPGKDRPVLYRLAYPDGPHDAEALLVAGDGRPVIVTKQGGGAGLYRPAAALRPGATVPLVRVGQVRLPSTRTRNPFSFVGRAVVTGGATAPDGRRVVLRTYADAFEFDVTGGDVVAALTTGAPRVVPLPDEPQGESVTYSRDGRFLLTVSETAGQPPGTRPTILRYALTSAPPPTGSRGDPAPTASRGAGAPARGDRGGATSPAVGAAVAALALLVLGMIMARGAGRAGR
ncbi:hypothetical protein C5N14_08320 [Micromonospora sp. MW-13]|uniref:hypothetical protein n=1 Tax=Micromonospora sp. MW-13 TaxID=2094022 RepID=UPI000EC00A31|nr:hypothetical protein [Micromonospora sp. MW-13]RGC69263.1 hypothetical protein C5N14_08320 [Micromonospora sp. MW-13]